MKAQLTYSHCKHFHSKYEVNPKTKCWEWTGSFTTDKGDNHIYPKMCLEKNSDCHYSARRISYLLHFGTMPEDSLGNKCCNYKCVNPMHLVPNPKYRQKIHKKWSSDTKKWKCITEKLVKQILSLKMRNYTNVDIARTLKVPQNTIIHVVKMARLCKENKLGSKENISKDILNGKQFSN